MRISDWSSDVCSSDLVLGVGHVDEVDDDDAAQVAQAQLPRDRLRGLQVGAVDGFLEVALAQERAGIDVDRGHRLGLVDDQVAAGLERDFLLQRARSEEHTSELQSLMRTSYAVFCLKKHTKTHTAK